MSDIPFMGELRLMSFAFAPRGWAACDGQILPINQNQALFSLLGTMYGGNGMNTFALPDLRGRTPVGVGGSAAFVQGQPAGEEFHTLSVGELPAHAHPVRASAAAGNLAGPGMLAAANNAYRPLGDTTTLAPATLGSTGGNQAHENRPPSLTLMWCIATSGIFPSPT